MAILRCSGNKEEPHLDVFAELLENDIKLCKIEVRNILSVCQDESARTHYSLSPLSTIMDRREHRIQAPLVN